MSLPGRHFSYVVTTCAEGVKHILCHSTGGGLEEAHVQFSLEFAPCAFPVANFALHPSVVINHSQSPSSKSWKLGVVLGTASTRFFSH